DAQAGVPKGEPQFLTSEFDFDAVDAKQGSAEEVHFPLGCAAHRRSLRGQGSRPLPRIAKEARSHPWQLSADGYPHQHRQEERCPNLDTYPYRSGNPPTFRGALLSVACGRRNLSCTAKAQPRRLGSVTNVAVNIHGRALRPPAMPSSWFRCHLFPSWQTKSLGRIVTSPQGSLA